MHAPAHPFTHRASRSDTLEALAFGLFRAGTYFILLCATLIFGVILFRGAGTLFQSTPPFINVPFFTQAPETLYLFEFEGKKLQLGDHAFRTFRREHGGIDIPAETVAYSAGGIFPCIVGTVLLVAGSMTIALLVGVSSAIYLNEYSNQGRFVHFIRLAILNLSGVPSIVFGLFGLGLFVNFLGWNVCLLAGWFTLAFMALPVVITASEESLKAVPKGFREGSLALGATKWQTVRTNVLPYALPGILTSSILGIARIAGETAPIMFTAAYVVRDKLPWQVDHALDFFFQGVMALPYHIYVVSSKIPQNEHTERVQYGAALVFLLVVGSIALTSIILRGRLRNRYRW